MLSQNISVYVICADPYFVGVRAVESRFKPSLASDVVSCYWFLGKNYSQSAQFSLNRLTRRIKRNWHISRYFILESIVQGFVKIELFQRRLKNLLEKNPT